MYRRKGAFDERLSLGGMCMKEIYDLLGRAWQISRNDII